MGTVLTYLCSLAFDGLINICPLTAQQRVTEHLLQDSFTGGDIYFKNILKYQIMPIVTTVTYHNFSCCHYCFEWAGEYGHEQKVCHVGR